MHNIKKSIRKNIALAAVMLMAVFTLAACGKKDDGGSFGFNNGSVLLTPGEKFSADDEGMPETLQYMEAASCYFEGLDKVFTYDGYEITTYPKTDGDYIQDVNVSSETIRTDKEAHLRISRQPTARTILFRAKCTNIIRMIRNIYISLF